MTFSLQRMVPSIVTGLVAASINVGVTASLAALVFSGGLSPFAANGIGLFLLGAIIALVVTQLFSTYSGTVSTPQDAPAAILAVMAAAIVAALPDTALPKEKFMTVAASVVLTSLLTGVFFILLGRFRLGALVRFLPYPVVGGFLAGTGWLLVTGGISFMADVPFSLGDLGTLFRPGVWGMWLPGLIVAVVMLLALNRYNHFLLLPALLLAATVLFYVFIWLADIPVAQAASQGWLLGPLPAGSLWKPLPISDLALIHWPLLLSQATQIATIVFVSVVSLLLNAGGIELVVRRDMDLNRELSAAGLANLIGGLLGGLVSYQALSDTTLNYRLGRGSRLTIWVNAAACALILFFGATLLALMPKLVIGSLLVLLGLFFLYEWIYEAWFKFSRVEYGVIVLILVVIATVGYLQGVGIGLSVAVVLFVIDYSRVNVVRFELSGADLESRVVRSPAHQLALEARGDEIYVLYLQGFIFFGTANNLLEHIRGRLTLKESPRPRYVILDFRQVTGIDSTALLSFNKLKQVAVNHDVILVLTHLSTQVRQQFDRGGFTAGTEAVTLIFADLDHGLEWCEDQILASTDQPAPITNASLAEYLGAIVPDAKALPDLFKYLEPEEVEVGCQLMQQGEMSEDLYFIETGSLTAELETSLGNTVRLGSTGPGQVMGEVGFYLRERRTASVMADQPSRVYRLSADRLRQMEAEAPEAASTLHQIIIHVLSKRVAHLIRFVNALQR